MCDCACNFEARAWLDLMTRECVMKTTQRSQYLVCIQRLLTPEGCCSLLRERDGRDATCSRVRGTVKLILVMALTTMLGTAACAGQGRSPPCVVDQMGNPVCDTQVPGPN